MPYSEQTTLAAAKRDGRKYYFMICDMCIWCASIFEPDSSKYRDAFLCPVCQGSEVQAIPLASNEVYYPIERVLVRVSLVDILVKRSHRHQTSIVSE